MPNPYYKRMMLLISNCVTPAVKLFHIELAAQKQPKALSVIRFAFLNFEF
jgi:hypothetical protein